VAGTAWFAYGSIFLLQSKLLWGIWEHRDLSSGDTSSYFHSASDWSQSFHVASIASPLYTVAWGSLRWLLDDPYMVTIAHRMLIAIGAALMVLAVLRRLLSPGIAWALAFWWTVLPVNYDNLYEVHLFAVITTLAAVLSPPNGGVSACARRSSRCSSSTRCWCGTNGHRPGDLDICVDRLRGAPARAGSEPRAGSWCAPSRPVLARRC
jgi:hypothetical protein